MGLLDKVKEQAAAAGAAAKDAAQKGQAKLNEVQAKRAADGLLRDLGALTYGERSGRTSPTTSSDIDRVLAALHSHEDEHGMINLEMESGL